MRRKSWWWSRSNKLRFQRRYRPGLVRELLLQNLSLRFGQLRRDHRSEEERRTAQIKGPRQPAGLADPSDYVWSYRTQGAGAVISEAEGAGAQGRGKEFAAHDA